MRGRSNYASKWPFQGFALCSVNMHGIDMMKATSGEGLCSVYSRFRYHYTTAPLR